MARERWMTATAQTLPAVGVPDFDDGGPTATATPPVSNALLAVVLFMGAETMLFIGLIGAFVLYKTASVAWPPPGQPRLPIAVTFANTAVLLASGVMMQRANSSLREGFLGRMRIELAAAWVMGVVFLAVQGFEWTQLIRHGLTLASSNYAATFYTLIGLHALHVCGAVAWLAFVLVGALRGRYSQERYTAVQACGAYWYFVCALWVGLFGAVYLS